MLVDGHSIFLNPRPQWWHSLWPSPTAVAHSGHRGSGFKFALSNTFLSCACKASSTARPRRGPLYSNASSLTRKAGVSTVAETSGFDRSALLFLSENMSFIPCRVGAYDAIAI